MIDHIQTGSIILALFLLFIPHSLAMWAVIALIAFAGGIEVCRVVQ